MVEVVLVVSVMIMLITVMLIMEDVIVIQKESQETSVIRKYSSVASVLSIDLVTITHMQFCLHCTYNQEVK